MNYCSLRTAFAALHKSGCGTSLRGQRMDFTVAIGVTADIE